MLSSAFNKSLLSGLLLAVLLLLGLVQVFGSVVLAKAGDHLLLSLLHIPHALLEDLESSHHLEVVVKI